MDSLEFISRSSVDAATVQFWIDEEWLLPPAGGSVPQFSETDLARARLIRDLTCDFGVNHEGVAIILHLIDQIHGLRSIVRTICAEQSGHARNGA